MLRLNTRNQQHKQLTQLKMKKKNEQLKNDQLKTKKAFGAAEAEKKRTFDTAEAEKQRNHEMLLRRERAQTKLNKTSGKLQVIEAKVDMKAQIPRYEKYQGIVRFYTSALYISS